MWSIVTNIFCNSESGFCAFYQLLYMQLHDASILGSVANTLVVALDRYIAILKSLQYHQIVTHRRVTKTLILTWALPVLYSFTFYLWLLSNRKDIVPDIYRYPVAFSFYFLVCFFLLHLHIRIYLIAKRHRRRIHQQETDIHNPNMSTSHHCLEQRKSKTSKMLIYMVVAYILAWTPFIKLSTLLTLVDVSYRANVIMDVISNIAQLLGYVNSGWNILICITKHKAMRKAYVDTACSWKSCMPHCQQRACS